MATAAADPDTECSICHELFRDPKVLWCGHELCAPCLVTLLTSHRDAPCPLCRRPILLPPDCGQRQSLQSLQSVVDSLPTDLGMKLWVDSERLLSQDYSCVSCLTQAATCLCLHCRDFLCSPCTAQHGRLSSSRDHQVETLSTLTPQKLAASLSAPCHAHPSEVSRLYCCTHRAAICLLCATSKHRTCGQLKDVEERAAEIRAVLTDVLSTLDGQESRLDQALQELDRLELDTQRATQAAQAEIDATFDNLEAALKQRRLQAKNSCGSQFLPCKTALHDRRVGLGQQRAALTTHRGIAERGRDMVASGDMGEMAAAMKHRAQDINVSPVAAADVPVVATAALTISSEAVSAVEKALAALEPGGSMASPARAAAQVSSLAALEPGGSMASPARAAAQVSSLAALEPGGSMASPARAAAQVSSLAALEPGGSMASPARAAAQVSSLAALEPGGVMASPARAAAQALQFRFHDNCGRNVVLSNNHHTAERKGDDNGGGIVISSQPMVPNQLYQVHLDEVEAGSGSDCMMVGAVTTAPDSLTCLPHNAGRWPVAVVFLTSCVDVHYTRTRSYVGRKLWKLPQGSCVGLMLDGAGSLHLYVDGEDQGHAGTSLTQPCFPVFDVCFAYRKVTALPITTVV